MNYQLESFKVYTNAHGNTIVLIKGNNVFLKILAESFSKYRSSPVFPDQYQEYDYGMYINEIESDGRQNIKDFLAMLSNHVYLDDRLHCTFALDYHMCPPYYSDCIDSRTELGDCVYHAKYNNNIIKANKLVKHFANFISQHPLYKQADYLLPVPYFGEKKFDLPTFLVNKLNQHFDKVSINQAVQKTKKTPEMKNITDPLEKFEHMVDCYSVVDNVFDKRTIIIVDDLYHTGTTIEALEKIVSNAGAKVLGLVATKTLKASNWD